MNITYTNLFKRASINAEHYSSKVCISLVNTDQATLA